MKELERDVRLNYFNIIKLMDIEPFYQIIYRYSTKLNKIQQVFNAFKNQPDEIPEQAVHTKSVHHRLAFIAEISQKLEYFLDDSDTDSNFNTRRSQISDKILITLAPQINIEELGELAKIVNDSKSLSTKGSFNAQKNSNKKEIAVQTDPNSERKTTKKSSINPSVEQSDTLKNQAEYLIRSVDSLISATGDTDNLQSKLINQAFQSNPLYLQKMRRLSKQMNSSTATVSGKLPRKRESSEPKEKSLNISEKRRRKSRNSHSHKQTSKLNLSQYSNYRNLLNTASPKPSSSNKLHHFCKESNSSINSKVRPYKPFMTHSKQDKQGMTKTERLLSLYRKNKIASNSSGYAGARRDSKSTNGSGKENK